jgi:hypothetical protein
MKTAEELYEDTFEGLNIEDNEDLIPKIMKEFAKMHVKAAIKECIESAPSGSSTDTVSYEDVVECLTDCYPLTNIK